MCTQELYFHTCTHVGYGPRITCGLPSIRGHQTQRNLQYRTTPCPSCSTLAFSSIAPGYPTQFYRPLYLLQSQPRVQAIPYYYQPAFLYQRPAPAPQPQAFFQPGQAWVPREIRYELINGVPTPVEQFYGLHIGLSDLRGYNPIHGYDTGPPPPIGTVTAQARGYNPLHGFDDGPPPPAQVLNRSLAQRVFGGTQGSSAGNSIGSAVTLVGEPEEGSHTAQEPAQNAGAEPSASSGVGDSVGDTAASDASSTAATSGSTEPATSSANDEESDSVQASAS